MSSLLVTAPGVRPLVDVGGSNALSVPVFRSFGQQGESWQLLEGVSTNQARAPSGFGNYFDFAVVAEGTVRTTGNSAEVPFRGIYLDQVVKSGANQFHGGGYGTWTNHNLVANNVTDELIAQGITQAPKVNVRRDVTASSARPGRPRQAVVLLGHHAEPSQHATCWLLPGRQGDPVLPPPDWHVSLVKMNYQNDRRQQGGSASSSRGTA